MQRKERALSREIETVKTKKQLKNSGTEKYNIWNQALDGIQKRWSCLFNPMQWMIPGVQQRLQTSAGSAMNWQATHLVLLFLWILPTVGLGWGHNDMLMPKQGHSRSRFLARGSERKVPGSQKTQGQSQGERHLRVTSGGVRADVSFTVGHAWFWCDTTCRRLCGLN